MIVTQALLLAVGGCTDIVQHLVDTGYEGLTRQQFIDKMQEDADAGVHPQWWVGWAKLYLKGGAAIVFNGEFVKTNRFSIAGLGITDPTIIFTSIEEARSNVRAARNAQNLSEDWAFHVHAKCPSGEDSHTLENCDLNGDGVFDHAVTCYQVFNITTGLYENYDLFEDAKARCLQLQQTRWAEVDAGYSITEEVQQINDPEENPSGWILVDIGDALA